uniref:Uncharacterized protein n=1 Tax=Tanacetum cinerariifolium TaxID=118510 RepID=A0A6L2KDR0_TANCI|nr:hypothetical protein [Tanacetum cinerariifolium]
MSVSQFHINCHNHSSITAQQAKLDLELVPKEKRLEIGKCNERLNPGKTEREPTLRSLSGKISSLDKLCLSRAKILRGMCYKKNVDYVELLWEDFTYQINNRGHKKQKKMYYPRFTNVIIYYFITKDKTVSRRNKIGMHTSRDDHLINTLRFVSVNEAIKFKKPASPKLTTVPASPKESTKKSKRVKRPANKSTNAPIAGVVIRDTLGVSVSKKKAPAKKALKKSKQETHKLQESGLNEGDDFESEVLDESKAKSLDTSEGNGVKPRVLDVSKADSFESVNKSWEDSEDNNKSDDNNDKGSENDDDDDENKEFDDEEYDDSYKDVNVRSKVIEHKEVGKRYVEMTDATRESGSQEKPYEQVVEDVHVTLTTSRKTEGSKQSSYVSSNFASKFVILDNVSLVIDEVASMMNVKVHQEESSTQAPPFLLVPVTAILETSSV